MCILSFGNHAAATYELKIILGPTCLQERYLFQFKTREICLVTYSDGRSCDHSDIGDMLADISRRQIM